MGAGLNEPIAGLDLFLHPFIGPRPQKYHGCHNDGNPENNRLENLRWDTCKGNHADKKKHGTWQVGERNGFHKLTDDVVREIKKRNASATVLAAKFNASSGNIYRIWYCGGWPHIQ